MYKFAEGEKVSEILCSQQAIATRVKELAAEINRDYAGKTILLLGTLTGSTIFFADLARELTLDVQIDFIKVSSYGAGTESSGTVKIDYEPLLKLEDRHVVIVEDIIDTGHTAVFLREYFKNKNVASIALCALLNKPERREVENLACEYLGFTIENKFVVGYGLDYDQRYRNLPYVGVLELAGNQEVL